MYFMCPVIKQNRENINELVKCEQLQCEAGVKCVLSCYLGLCVLIVDLLL